MSDEKLVQNAGSTRGPIKAAKRKHGPGHSLVGKIARLPKAIREMLNRRLEDGVPASVLAAWLNELPPVQTVLASYFGGAAITQKNISNWHLTGFKRWQEKQEILAEVRELAEEAADINESNPDGLMRMTATLACTKLLRALRDDKSGTDINKTAFAIAALNNVEISHVRMRHEEQRLTQKDAGVELAWDKHFRDCAAIGLRLMSPAPSSEEKPQAPKRELSDYDKALREGKTHEEALYAQFTRVEKPKEPEVSLYPKPNPLDSCSEPVHYTPQPGPSAPLYGPCEPPLTASFGYNLRPPPGWNTLG